MKERSIEAPRSTQLLAVRRLACTDAPGRVAPPFGRIFRRRRRAVGYTTFLVKVFTRGLCQRMVLHRGGERSTKRSSFTGLITSHRKALSVPPSEALGPHAANR